MCRIMSKIREVVSVYLLPKELEKVRQYSDEESLSLSATIRNLALKQLRYLEWESKGKPQRSKSKEGRAVAEKVPFMSKEG